MPKSLQGLSLLGTYSTVCLQKCIQESLIESVLEQHCAEAHHSRGNITRAVSLLADPLTRAGSCAPFLIHKRIQEKYINAILFLLWKLLLLVIAGALLKNGIPSSHRWELHSAVLQLTCLEHTVNCSCQSWSLPEDDGFRWCPTSKDPKKGRDVIKEVEINTENPHFRSRRYWKHWWAVLENTWLVFLDACAVWLILMASFFFFFTFCLQYLTYLALTTIWLRVCQALLAACGTERCVHPQATCWHAVMGNAFCVCFSIVSSLETLTYHEVQRYQRYVTTDNGLILTSMLISFVIPCSLSSFSSHKHTDVDEQRKQERSFLNFIILRVPLY